MKTFQLIFQGGRVQNLWADRWSREEGVIHFHAGRLSQQFAEESLIMVDELSDEGFVHPVEVGSSSRRQLAEV